MRGPRRPSGPPTRRRAGRLSFVLVALLGLGVAACDEESHIPTEPESTQLPSLTAFDAAAVVASSQGRTDPGAEAFHPAALAELSQGFVDPDLAASGAALVIKNDGRCGLVGADANGDMVFGSVGISTTRVENANRVALKCRGRDITNMSGRGQSFSGFWCGVAAPSGAFCFTTDSHSTVSASGVGALTCVCRD